MMEIHGRSSGSGGEGRGNRGRVVIDGVDLLIGDRSSNLYTIALNEVASNSSTCLLAKASSSQSWLWHQRISHLNFATINNLVKNNLVQGLPKMKLEKDHLCSTCEQGKIHRKHHKSKTAFASNKPLYLLHMDLCGTMRVESINGKRYVLVVVDDYSRYTWRIQTHNGMEFKNKTLAKFFDEVGITQQFSAARTPQQNGVVKRRNRTLVEARKPNIKFFRVFKCRCYLLNDYEDVEKLKAKGDIGVFVGYSKESTAFRIYNKRIRKIHKSVNVNFDEISKMASKQFSLEPGLSNLNKTGKSSNTSVSQVSETSKKDLEDLFQNFYDEYFDSLKIMKSSTTNVETSNVEEVGVPSSNTQSISNNMIPNVDEASTSHNVFNEHLEDAYFDASTSFDDPFIEPANVAEALRDADCVSAMQEELDQFARLKTTFLNGILNEEVYVGQPPGFVSEQYSDHVYALNKALYVPTPMVEQAKLKLNLVGKPVDHTDYRSMIGSLISCRKQNCVSISGSVQFLDDKLLLCSSVVDAYSINGVWLLYDKVMIYYDSKSAIAISCNPDQVQGQILCTRLIKIQVTQKKVKIAFENVDSSSRVELIPSKIKLTEDFGKRFTPQQEFLAEQAFWLRMSDPTSKPSDALPVKIEAPKELLKISFMNESLKKLKFHLAKFDIVVRIRTTPNPLTEDLQNKLMKVQAVFSQMSVVVQPSSVDKQCLKIAKKELLLENDRLLQQIMSQDVLLTVMNSMSLIGDIVNMDGIEKNLVFSRPSF
nr:hypothetical protein [Tanacetum cinerariifolium]